jgi:hypothetical protein
MHTLFVQITMDAIKQPPQRDLCEKEELVFVFRSFLGISVREGKRNLILEPTHPARWEA